MTHYENIVVMVLLKDLSIHVSYEPLNETSVIVACRPTFQQECGYYDTANYCKAVCKWIWIVQSRLALCFYQKI